MKYTTIVRNPNVNYNFSYALCIEKFDNRVFSEPYKIELVDWLSNNIGDRGHNWDAMISDHIAAFLFKSQTDMITFKLWLL